MLMVALGNVLVAALSVCVPVTRPVSRPRAAPPVCIDPGQPGAARETILALLSQRSVQTQIFLNRQFKNGAQRKWLERFCSDTMGAPSLSKAKQTLHAADAMLGIGEKDDFLLRMMAAPDETHEVVIKSKFRQGSPNNPYLQGHAHEQTYTETVQPVKVAHQLMRLREGIAVEWLEDVQLFRLDNEELRRHHTEEVRNRVDEQERYQHAISPGSPDGEDTPLRAASYDLLKTAATRCAVRRLYRELDKDSLQRHSAEWLQIFLASRDYPLSGEVDWHAARHFLLALMEQPVSVSASLGGNLRYLDPVDLAERVMDLRVEIGEEWAEILAEVPDGHLRVNRIRLECNHEEECEAEAKFALARVIPGSTTDPRAELEAELELELPEIERAGAAAGFEIESSGAAAVFKMEWGSAPNGFEWGGFF